MTHQTDYVKKADVIAHKNGYELEVDMWKCGSVEAACKQIVEKFEAGDFTSTKSIDVISTTTNQHA